MGILIYLLFLRGLYYLRKVVASYLSGQIFSDHLIADLRRSGKDFLYAGVFVLAYKFVSWFLLMDDETIKLEFGLAALVPFFLMIIGSFIKIQSESMNRAKELQEEASLTI